MTKRRDDTTTDTDNLYYSVFKSLGESHIDNLLEDLQNSKDAINNITISQTFIHWGKSHKKRYHKNINRLNLSKIAIILVVIISIFSVSSLSVEANRNYIYKFIIEMKESFTRFYYYDEVMAQSDPMLDINHYYYPTVMLKGYSYSAHKVTRDIISLTYSNRIENILFIQYETQGDYNIDIENAEITEVDISGYTGMLILKEDKTMLFWQNDHNEFLIIGSITKESILKIAESIKYK